MRAQQPAVASGRARINLVPMSTVAVKISSLLPKLRPAERDAIRALLDEADYAAWREDTTKFRRLMRGKARDNRPASQMVSATRR